MAVSFAAASIFEIIAAGAAVAAVGVSIYSGAQQEKQAKEANKLTTQARTEQKKQADVQNLRSRRKAARESIHARSVAVASGANEGGTVSSSTAGAAGAAITEGATNISFLDSMAQSQGRELAYNTRADAVFGKIQNLKNMTSIAQTGLGLAQNKNIERVFG